MTKEDIINEYIPFFVKEMLKKADPPKGEEELIKYSQAFGRELLERQPLPDAEQSLKIQDEVKKYCYIDQDDMPVITVGGIRSIIKWQKMIE